MDIKLLTILAYTAGVFVGAVVANLFFHHRSAHGVFTVNMSNDKDTYRLLLTSPIDKLRKSKKIIFKVVKAPTDVEYRD